MANSWPIVGFVGPNGGGKTLAMVVSMALPAMMRGDPILANFRLSYDRWIPLTTWQQVLDFDNGTILLDEVSSWVPSRESSKLPPEVLSDLNQMRKGNRRVGWAGPAWGRCDKALREVSQAACWCRGYALDTHQRDKSATHDFPFTGPKLKGRDGRPLMVDGWEDRRLFRWSWFDPYSLPEDVSAQDMDSPPKGVRPKRTMWYWRPAHAHHLLYNSREKVLMLDTVDPSGSCLACGGARARRKCDCEGRNARLDVTG